MRLTWKNLILVAVCLVGLGALGGCGGDSQGSNATPQNKHLTGSQKTANSNYNQVVEQLYVAYFGRPADPNGLVNFSAQLAADGAPTDIQSLLQSYNTNNGVKALIDSFGTSAESQTLYGTANPTSFVTAVFQNVLGRTPQQAGLDFWVNSLNSGSVTYGNVALQIMAGALVNTSAQGQLDAQLIGNRITVATDFSADLTAQNATADYVGSTAAQTARNMLAGITANTDSGTFQGTANATVATLIANPPPVNNTVSIIVDKGADPQTNPSVDAAFVSVKICAPGNPSLCQIIDHVLVDTGSYGLRLLYSTLNTQMAATLKAQSSGNTLVECTSFLDGYSWGPVRQVDFSIAGEAVSNMNLQIIGDPSFNGIVPRTCSGTAKAEDRVDTFGSNGVLGVGLLQQDCGQDCTTETYPGLYYTCSNGACSQSTASLSQQVQNPVSQFASDNNGVIVKLPAVSLSGQATVSGTLVFGVNTQSDNALGTAQVFQMDSSLYFTTIYAGQTMSASFIDSGSNGLYFDTPDIAQCADDFYCPDSTLSLSAVMQGAPNLVSQVQNTQTIPFYIGNVDSSTNAALIQLGAPIDGNATSDTFDWGLPFFYGRNVYVVMSGKTVAGQQGPFVAF